MNKTKASAPESAPSTSRRAQPVRQTRTNPPRTSSLNRVNAHTGGSTQEQPIDIFPAVTHFADAITALPKELVRHFTLLKEVDAKICAPKQELFELIESLLNQPSSNQTSIPSDGANTVPLASARNDLHGDPRDSVNNSSLSGSPNNPLTSQGPFGASEGARRERFRLAGFKIHEMMMALEEKNHVISTANDALDKQLARISDLWPHLEGEFSEEAKWGSTTHWAYLENRVAKNNNTQAERSRREGAATLSAAAQQLAGEEAAARSSDRKKAIAEKKSSKAHAVEGEADGKTQEHPKKLQGSGKSRKPPADAAAPVGLGIAANAPVNGGSSSKRRKVEGSKTNGSAPMERAMSGIFGNNASKSKGTTSPRETPAPDAQSKKRKALPTSSNPAKKNRTAGVAASPSIVSSPVISNFPDNAKPGQSSPAPSNVPRPPSSRARQNSTQGTADSSRPRPSPATSTKPHGVPSGTPDLSIPNNAANNGGNAKVPKESASASKPEPPKPKPETIPPPPSPEPAPSITKKETASKAVEDGESKKESAPPASTPTTVTTVTTKSGRASKPSTPALATFAEAATARSRTSRNAEGGITAVKRSHKKGGSISAAALALAAQQAAAEDSHNKGPGDDGEGEDPTEPRYCYCNGVSYGEMVACDATDCPREWFHLECVGLRVAPKGNTKWFCDDCKNNQKFRDKKVNGR